MPRKDVYSLPKDYIKRLQRLGWGSEEIAGMTTDQVQSLLFNQTQAPPASIMPPGNVPQANAGPLSYRNKPPDPQVYYRSLPTDQPQPLPSNREDRIAAETQRLQNLADQINAEEARQAASSAPKSGNVGAGASSGSKAVQDQLRYANRTQNILLRQAITERKTANREENQAYNRGMSEAKQEEAILEREQKARIRQESTAIREANKRQNEIFSEAIKERKNAAFFNEQVAPYDQIVNQFSGVDPRFVDPTKATFKTKPMQQGYREISSTFIDEYGKNQTLKVVADQQGNAVDTLGKKYKSFGEQLKQNYAEVMRWSIAVSLLYAPMQKLSELTQAMVENQTRLAQVAVTLGTSQEATNRIFDAAAKIAKETGTNVEGVIEGYNLAVRATGDAATATERYAQAEDLLKNSITLSKLAGIDQSTATDILSAAYKQLKDQIGSSSELLDKWVTVSRSANVDVNTLATSFAVVAEAATNAGLSIDQLNGLISVIAEKTITSARETGNVVRALVSGYSTDQAVKALSRYGIAVTDAQGRTRNFMDVVADVKGQVNQGFIGKDQLNEIALAWGGGNRRQAQTVIGLLGYERMLGIAQTSANAPQGAASKALETLLNTIEGSINKLNVSFTELAQSLGTDGGILDALKGVIDAARMGVEVFTGLSRAIGGALPYLAGVGISGALFRPENKLNLLTPLLANLSTIGGGVKSVAGAGKAALSGVLENTEFGRVVSGMGIAMGEKFGAAAKAYAPAIGLTIATGLLAVMTRGAAGDWVGAGEIVAGGVVGGLIGSAVGLAPLGVVIGTTLAEAFVAETERNKNRIASAFASAGIPFQEVTPKAITALDSSGKKIETGLLAATYGADYAEIVKTRPQWMIDRETQKVGEFALRVQEDYATFQKQFGGPNMGWSTALGLVAGQDISKPGNINYGGFSKQYGTYNPIEAGLSLLAPERKTFTPEQFKDLYIKAQEDAIKATQTEYSKNVLGFGGTNRTVIEEMQRKQIDLLKMQFNTGDISQRTLATRRLDLAAGPGKAAALAYPLTAAGQDVTTTLNKVTEIIAKGTEDEVNNLVSYAAVIQRLNEQLETATKGLDPNLITDETTVMIDNVEYKIGELRKGIEQANSDYVDAFLEVYREMINRVEIPTIVDFTSNGLDAKDVDLIVKRLPEFIKKQVSELSAIDENYGQAFKTEQERSKTLIRSAEGDLTQVKATPELVRALYQNLKETNEIIKGMQIQQFKIKSSEYQDPNSAFNQTYNRIMKEATALGYTPNLENFVLYTEDKKLIEAIQKDTRVTGMAIEETNSLLEKQLNGVFNLPSGASFYVPYQAARMSRDTDEKLSTRTFNTAVDKFSNAVDEFRAERSEMGRSLTTGKLDRVTPRPYDEDFLAMKDLKAEQAMNGGYLPGYRGSYSKGTYYPGSSANSRLANPMDVPGFMPFLPDTNIYRYPTSAENESVNRSVSAKLDIKIDNKVTLVANGRVLAEVIKPYLESDLVTFSHSTTSRIATTTGYAIGV